MRSLLFVPGDSPRKMAKAMESGADGLILDLEDAVAPDRKQAAREATAEFIRAARRPDGPRLFVRVNALDSGLTDADLDVVMAAAPDGLVLPKCAGGQDVAHLAAKTAVREAEFDLRDGATAIIPVATESGASIFGLGSYAGCSRRLAALAWGAEDLCADIGAAANRDGAGLFTGPFRLARDLLLFGAAAAGVDAIDTVFTALADEAGLARECAGAARDGFAGKLAIHPAQIPVINAAFTPAPEAVAEAQAIVAAFAADSSLGVINIGGRMVDRPHLRQAQRLLARAGATGQASR